MLDSGHQFVHGIVDYKSFYKGMVDKELARPPMADVSATFWREGNHFAYEVTVKNLSGVNLSTQANTATVNVIVYEDIKVSSGVRVTGRVVRAVVTWPIDSPLANNSSARYSLQTKDLSGVNWAKLHSVVFAEYRPGGQTGAFDMLQAAIPTGPLFEGKPGNLNFLVDSLNPENQSQPVQMVGSPSSITWSAAENIDWLSVVPASGNAGDPANVQIDVSHMPRGTNTGTITIIAAGGGKNFSQTIPVRVDFTPVWGYFLPFILR